MVAFNSDWCPACLKMEDRWNYFGDWCKDHDIGVGKVDIALSPVLTGRAFILTWPTIFHIKDGVWRDYGRGTRKTRDLQYFIEQKQWKRFEPYFWFDPGKDIYIPSTINTDYASTIDCRCLAHFAPKRAS
jgi:hypothetical protein